MFLFGSPPSPEFLPLVSPQCPHQNADVWPRAARPREKGQRPASRSSSSSPHPRPFAHERGRTGPVDDRWGVCYARAPDPDTTQHNTRLCGPPQLGWNVTCFRLGPECVKHKWGRRRTRMEGCRERRGAGTAPRRVLGGARRLFCLSGAA